jgi:hypothetical protein
MSWEVEFTGEFATWWNGLSVAEQEEAVPRWSFLKNEALHCLAPMWM